MTVAQADLTISAILAGSDVAKEHFYAQHALYITAVLQKWVHERLTVEDELSDDIVDDAIVDVTTDTLVWAINNAHKHDPSRGSVATWLVEAAWSRIRRRIISETRSARRFLRVDDLEAVARPVNGPEYDLHEREFANEIKRVLALLQNKQADALLLVDYFGYDLQHVATALGIPSAAAASSLVRRARTSFKRHWRKRSETLR